ncbi:hypothetical protein SS12_13910 [Enterobacter hormaechei subsp. hoffmannii]|nr:hypothetical protein SS12_13910 [Enterobacter hormaechei subsp. hoffmannii]
MLIKEILPGRKIALRNDMIYGWYGARNSFAFKRALSTLLCIFYAVMELTHLFCGYRLAIFIISLPAWNNPKPMFVVSTLILGGCYMMKRIA